MRHRLKEEPPLPSALLDGLEPSYRAVILRLLKRKPSQRFASADDVARALAAGALG